MNYPNLDTAKLFFSWGFDIGYMVNNGITADEYKQVTGKDYVAPKA